MAIFKQVIGQVDKFELLEVTLLQRTIKRIRGISNDYAMFLTKLREVRES